MGDVQMQDAMDENSNGEQPPFSEAEKEILGLYDEVKKLELEIALAKARTRLAGKQSKYLACHPTPADDMQTKAQGQLEEGKEVLRAKPPR